MADEGGLENVGLSRRVKSEAGSYYLWPLVWLGPPPDGVSPFLTMPNQNVGQFGDIVAESELGVNVRGRAFRDGMFQFDFAGWAPYPEEGGGPSSFAALAGLALKRVALMNAHLACFYTAWSGGRALGATALDPSLILPTASFDEPAGVGPPLDSRMGWVLYMRTGVLSYMTEGRRHSPAVPRYQVELAVVEDSFSLLSQLLEHADAERMITYADLLVRSAAALSAHHYGVSLVTAWNVCEALLNELWERYISANRERNVAGEELPFIGSERKDFLTGRDMTARLVTESLSLLDELPFELYKGVNRVRKARNDWVHELAPVQPAVAEFALGTAEMMLGHVHEIELSLPRGLTLQT